MTWLHKFRPFLYVLGVVVVVGSLLGARLLSPGSGGGSSDPTQPKSAIPTNGKAGSGPVVIGYVDTDPGPVAHGLPPVLQSGTVMKVHVKQGDEVQKGAPLYEFDSRLQKADLENALAAVATARAKVDEARAGVEKHKKDIEVQELAVEVAKKEVELKLNAWKLGVTNAKESYKTAGYPENTWEERLSKEPAIFTLYSAHVVSEQNLKLQQLKLDTLKSLTVDAVVMEAQSEVKRYESLVEKAKLAVDLCVVKAEVSGTVEQINISPGTVLGISTRTVAVWLIPSGPRVVRAEVEAEFAHRVTQEKIGKEVTIYDHADGKITYKGTVRQIGGSFLPKRFGNDGLVGSDTRVLEAVIDVTDPAPAGKPPLRVGQKVRVNFGQ